MEVASLPAAASDTNDVSGVTSPRGKRLLQGRPLPAILVKKQPPSASLHHNSFRPHPPRPSVNKTKEAGGDRKGSGGGAIVLGLGGVRGEENSTPCDSGVSLSSPEGDPLHHHHHPQHSSLTSNSAVKGGPKTMATGSSPTGVAGASNSSAKGKKKTGRPKPAPPPVSGETERPGTNTISGVSLGGRTSEQQQHRQQHKKLSHLSQQGRTSYMEGQDYSLNPEPVPFMPSNFMSSTMLKKVPIPKRHQDTFGGYDHNFTGQRGVMLHTDRYQYEALRALEGLNQRDRLLAEMTYLEHLRGIKRRREVVPHRAQLDLFLGGRKIECEERFDLNREIQRLKAMAMPIRARDLYHGRGIHLPPSHHSIHPRAPRLDESDREEEGVRVSAPAAMQRPHPFVLDLGLPAFERQISLTLGDVPHTRSVIRGKRFNQLPSLSKIQTPRPGMQRDDTNTSRSSGQPPHSYRSAAWVEEQNHILSRHPKKQPTSQMSQEEGGTFITHPQKVALPPSATDKRLTPEPPPPTSEGGSRHHASLQKANPLKGGLDLGVSEEQVSNLRQTFQRLDTDMDGHLRYDQVKSQMPAEFSQQQECFVKQVYEITSSGTFFGVDEFMMMSQLTNRVASLTGPAQEAYGKINFETLEATIIRYVDLFQDFDSAQKGKISMDSLRELLGKSQNKLAMEETASDWNTILDSLRLEYSPEVSRMEFIAHIPLFTVLVPPAQPPQAEQQEEASGPPQ